MLAFVGTWGLVVPAIRNPAIYAPEQFLSVFPFQIGYFLLFSTATFLFSTATFLFKTATFLFKIVRGVKSDLFDLIALLVNAAVFFTVGSGMIDREPRDCGLVLQARGRR